MARGANVQLRLLLGDTERVSVPLIGQSEVSVETQHRVL
jgi:hypothetical protein